MQPFREVAFFILQKTKKTGNPVGSPLNLLKTKVNRENDYLWIASEGQTSAQVAHSVQRSGSITYFSPSEIAPDGHSSIHVPQAIQSSPIIKAIVVCYFIY